MQRQWRALRHSLTPKEGAPSHSLQQLQIASIPAKAPSSCRRAGSASAAGPGPAGPGACPRSGAGVRHRANRDTPAAPPAAPPPPPEPVGSKGRGCRAATPPPPGKPGRGAAGGSKESSSSSRPAGIDASSRSSASVGSSPPPPPPPPPHRPTPAASRCYRLAAAPRLLCVWPAALIITCAQAQLIMLLAPLHYSSNTVLHSPHDALPSSFPRTPASAIMWPHSARGTTHSVINSTPLNQLRCSILSFAPPSPPPSGCQTCSVRSEVPA